MPGGSHALKRSSKDISAMPPYKIKGKEGANNKPKLPDVVINPRLNLSE